MSAAPVRLGQPLPPAADPRLPPADLQVHHGPLSPAELSRLAPALAALERLTLADEAALWGEEGLSETLRSPQASVALLGELAALHAYCLYTCVAGECEILQIATHPQHTRRGLAQALLHAVFGQAIASDCDRVVLEVRRGNAAARALYDRCGFNQVGLRRSYYQRSGDSTADRTADDALLLARAL
ncbi:MAG TPA: GNAT family N-acetyltransferase [Pseudomonadota bacterium]|nr:GNAT family N-acetyltransferase [Pseudomonadota bacterium]